MENCHLHWTSVIKIHLSKKLSLMKLKKKISFAIEINLVNVSGEIMKL